MSRIFLGYFYFEQVYGGRGGYAASVDGGGNGIVVSRISGDGGGGAVRRYARFGTRSLLKRFPTRGVSGMAGRAEDAQRAESIHQLLPSCTLLCFCVVAIGFVDAGALFCCV